MVNHQTFTRTDVGNDGIAWNWTAAFREGDQHAVCTFDRQMTMARLCRYVRCCFALLEVFRYHHAHGITQTDFCEQIVKSGELHALKLTLDALWRDLSQFTATAQGMVEQSTAQTDGIIALEVFQQLANLGARFRTDDEVEPRGIRARTRGGNNLNCLTAKERL